MLHLWLFTALAAHVAIAQNECYYAAEKRAGSAIVPCGNGESYSSCCMLGDICLSDGACWDYDTNVTYLYGCTDPTYGDYTCPFKCGDAYNETLWVGVEYCSVAIYNEWTCTHPGSDSAAIVTNPKQPCTKDSVIAFAGPVVLQPVLSLPSAVGGSTEYFTSVGLTSWSLDPNYTPTTTSVSVTASKPTTVELVILSTSTVETTPTLTPTPTPTPTPTSIAEPSSNTAAKVGLAIGAVLGVAGVIALTVALFFFRRRTAKYHNPPQMTAEFQFPDRQPYGGRKLNGESVLSEMAGSHLNATGQFAYSELSSQGRTPTSPFSYSQTPTVYAPNWSANREEKQLDTSRLLEARSELD